MNAFPMEILARLQKEEFSAEEVAKRALMLFDALTPLHPIFGSLHWIESPVFREDVEPTVTPFDVIRRDMVSAILRGTGKDDDGMPDAKFEGFSGILRTTNRAPSPSTVAVSFTAGGRACLARTSLTTDRRIAADPTLLTFEVMRGATLALCEPFQATSCFAFPDNLRPYWDLNQRCKLGAMIYLGPEAAAMITPPVSAIVEHRPNGGLFMAATRDTFDAENPRHLAVARDINDAIRPYNDWVAAQPR